MWTKSVRQKSMTMKNCYLIPKPFEFPPLLYIIPEMYFIAYF